MCGRQITPQHARKDMSSRTALQIADRGVRLVGQQPVVYDRPKSGRQARLADEFDDQLGPSAVRASPPCVEPSRPAAVEASVGEGDPSASRAASGAVRVPSEHGFNLPAVPAHFFRREHRVDAGPADRTLRPSPCRRASGSSPSRARRWWRRYPIVPGTSKEPHHHGHDDVRARAHDGGHTVAPCARASPVCDRHALAAPGSPTPGHQRAEQRPDCGGRRGRQVHALVAGFAGTEDDLDRLAGRTRTVSAPQGLSLTRWPFVENRTWWPRKCVGAASATV